MIKFILNSIVRLLEENPDIFISDREKDLLKKAEEDLTSFKHINFYALDAEQQLNGSLKLIEYYQIEMSRILDSFANKSSIILANNELIHKIRTILTNLSNKQNKITQLKEKIPQGVLDIKRAMYIAESSILSNLEVEDKEFKLKLQSIKEFLCRLNKDYMALIKQGGLLNPVLISTTAFYWNKFHEYSSLLRETYTYLRKLHQLTEEGQLALDCFNSAIQKLPSKKSITGALKILNQKDKKIDPIKKIGFVSSSGREACLQLTQLGKQFFYIPRKEEMHHFDYIPKEDLNDTGGNCYGESIMFIHHLSKGEIRWLCPEAGLINFQLDQTRNLKFNRKNLGEGETEVSEDSAYDSLEWEDMKPVLVDNPLFKSGNLCGVIFSMNDYTKSQRDFTAGHIIVVAKFDTELNPYKYIIYEKDFGAFGLMDDESLEYIITQQILPLYKGMNYSKMRLVQYEEASAKTYDLLNSIKPQTTNAQKKLMAHSATKSHLFFKAPTEAADISEVLETKLCEPM